MEWQPIETAPKDGAEILATGYNYGLMDSGRHRVITKYLDGEWADASNAFRDTFGYLTHWMPLPEPPETMRQREGILEVAK
jgi:hypothetical protein